MARKVKVRGIHISRKTREIWGTLGVSCRERAETGLPFISPLTCRVIRTQDGTVIEIFEWVSEEAIAGAHANPAVLAIWKRFEAVCCMKCPRIYPEFQKMFAHFEPV